MGRAGGGGFDVKPLIEKINTNYSAGRTYDQINSCYEDADNTIYRLMRDVDVNAFLPAVKQMVKASNGVSKTLKCWFYPNVVSTVSRRKGYMYTAYSTDQVEIDNYFYADISNGEVTRVRDMALGFSQTYDGATPSITDSSGGYDVVGTVYKVE